MATLDEILGRSEDRRLQIGRTLLPETKERLGQYFTPIALAQFISDFPELSPKSLVRILDPGAGTGSLTSALVARMLSHTNIQNLELVLVEIDESLAEGLRQSLKDLKNYGRSQNVEISYKVHVGDYLEIGQALGDDFDYVIMNPPYGKINSKSTHRRHLATLGFDPPNLYAAFMTIGIMNLSEHGQLIAITPRSFTNGVYFKSFRRYLLGNMKIDRMHLFGSRNSLFADSDVLQENLIIACTKTKSSGNVIISSSVDLAQNCESREVSRDEVVHREDPECFIRVPSTALDSKIVEKMRALPHTLSSFLLQASTGKIVEFRNKRNLQSDQTSLSAPMIYPSNIQNGSIIHPGVSSKSNWFNYEEGSLANLLIPAGNYVVVKRFSAKEENRRVVAALWSLEDNGNSSLALDNKLNFIHCGWGGFDKELAIGVAIWLNSSLVDKYFRTFSGHTQVNAADLRSIPFPDKASLERLNFLAEGRIPSQERIDAIVNEVLQEILVAA